MPSRTTSVSGEKKSARINSLGPIDAYMFGKLTIIGTDNGLSPGRRQAITWTYAGSLLMRHFGTNFSETLIGIQTFSFKKMHLKLSSAKWRPFCLGLNVFNVWQHLKVASYIQICIILNRLWYSEIAWCM